MTIFSESRYSIVVPVDIVARAVMRSISEKEEHMTIEITRYTNNRLHIAFGGLVEYYEPRED